MPVLSFLPPRLTPRQVQILLMRAHGLTGKETAHALGISAGAVRDHVTRALGRMDAPSLVSAVWAARRQLELA